MFKEDLSAFFNDNEMATTAYFGASTIFGILDSRFLEVFGVESLKPVFICAAEDVTAVQHGDTLAINEINYRVVGSQPDGTGLMDLILERD